MLFDAVISLAVDDDANGIAYIYFLPIRAYCHARVGLLCYSDVDCLVSFRFAEVERLSAPPPASPGHDGPATAIRPRPEARADDLQRIIQTFTVRRCLHTDLLTDHALAFI